MNLGICRGCKKSVAWVKTEAGKNTCLEQMASADGNILVKRGDDGVYRSRVVGPLEKLTLPPGTVLFKSHWATCPAADRFRKLQAAKKERASRGYKTGDVGE